LELKEFQEFDSTATALEELTAVIEGKVTPRLANLLDSIKDEKKSSLAIANPKLGMIAFLSSLTVFFLYLMLMFYP
jgi:nucleolar protein 58